VIKLLEVLNSIDALPAALIMEGPAPLVKQKLSAYLSTWICACGHCANCHLIAQNEHPDIYWISPEQSGHAIKVEQIREVLSDCQQTPHLLSRQLVIIEAADTMNLYAANALLKSLEEPNGNLHFILLVAQHQFLPATLRSRCWMVRIEHDTLEFSSELLQSLQSDILSFMQHQMDLSTWLKKYESFSVEEVLLGLQNLIKDYVFQRLSGQSILSYDIVFQVSLPLQHWWLVWDKLLDYRSICRTQTALNRDLIFSDILIALRTG